MDRSRFLLASSMALAAASRLATSHARSCEIVGLTAGPPRPWLPDDR
ncbi:Uncharacterised protein [Mycobacteroides abscessus subsp. abscessus]|nr:Uncharacterised protein [Mycobacteroides abscessus subsp. abscessus]